LAFLNVLLLQKHVVIVISAVLEHVMLRLADDEGLRRGTLIGELDCIAALIFVRSALAVN
jgi:hypothetical protein